MRSIRTIRNTKHTLYIERVSAHARTHCKPFMRWWRHRFAWLNVITFCVFVLIISFWFYSFGSSESKSPCDCVHGIDCEHFAYEAAENPLYLFSCSQNRHLFQLLVHFNAAQRSSVRFGSIHSRTICFTGPLIYCSLIYFISLNRHELSWTFMK